MITWGQYLQYMQKTRKIKHSCTGNSCTLVLKINTLIQKGTKRIKKKFIIINRDKTYAKVSDKSANREKMRNFCPTRLAKFKQNEKFEQTSPNITDMKK